MKGWSAGLLSSVGAWTRHLGGSGICVSQEVAADFVCLWESSCDDQTASTHRLVSPGEQPLWLGTHSSEAELQVAGASLCHPLPPPRSATRVSDHCDHGEPGTFVRGGWRQCALHSGLHLFFVAVSVNIFIFL